jgi:hypothetical protein
MEVSGQPHAPTASSLKKIPCHAMDGALEVGCCGAEKNCLSLPRIKPWPSNLLPVTIPTWDIPAPENICTTFILIFLLSAIHLLAYFPTQPSHSSWHTSDMQHCSISRKEMGSKWSIHIQGNILTACTIWWQEEQNVQRNISCLLMGYYCPTLVGYASFVKEPVNNQCCT